MPTYTFFCDTCGVTFDMHFFVSDRNKMVGKKCSECGGKIKRAVGSCNFVLKGDCWARDGYIKDVDKAEHFNNLCKD